MTLDVSHERFGAFTAWPEGLRALLGVDRSVDAAGLPARLLELVRLRISQVNGCAFCVSMHVAKARALGVDEDDLALLCVWREAPGFSAREKSALDVCEAITRLEGREAVARAVDSAAEQFTPAELTVLVFAVGAINAWNRLALADGLSPRALR